MPECPRQIVLRGWLRHGLTPKDGPGFQVLRIVTAPQPGQNADSLQLASGDARKSLRPFTRRPAWKRELLRLRKPEWMATNEIIAPSSRPLNLPACAASVDP